MESRIYVQFPDDDYTSYMAMPVDAIQSYHPAIVYWNANEGLSKNRSTWRYEDPKVRVLLVEDLPSNEEYCEGFYGTKADCMFPNPAKCWERKETKRPTCRKRHRGNDKEEIVTEFV